MSNFFAAKQGLVGWKWYVGGKIVFRNFGKNLVLRRKTGAAFREAALFLRDISSRTWYNTFIALLSIAGFGGGAFAEYELF